MSKILTVMLALVFAVLAGCTPVAGPANTETAEVDEFSDEEVIVESDDGIDEEEMRLRQGDGYMMNLVDTYTIPIDEGDSEASADQILVDPAGTEYKIVDHIGPDSE